MDKLLNLARRCHGGAQVTQCLSGGVQLFLALNQPVLQFDVVATTTARLVIQFIRGVHRNDVLHVAEQLFEIDDIAIVFVITVEPVGAANCLEQVMVPQLVVQIDI
ncbi:hypothetical protein D3C85_1194420 [compost metagenome]